MLVAKIPGVWLLLGSCYGNFIVPKEFVEGERIAQLAQSWSMRDFRLVALLTPIWML